MLRQRQKAKYDMSVAADSSPAYNTHAPRQDGCSALLEESHNSQADGSFQVPDSDNDESLEELAVQQEQEYWSMLGVEDAQLSVYGSSPPSSVRQTAVSLQASCILLTIACCSHLLHTGASGHLNQSKIQITPRPRP
jgi:hypothetical protein